MRGSRLRRGRYRRHYYNSGCLVLILAGALVFIGGCGWVANPRSKLATEAKKQTLILERIAVAIEECNYEFKD